MAKSLTWKDPVVWGVGRVERANSCCRSRRATLSLWLMECFEDHLMLLAFYTEGRLPLVPVPSKCMRAQPPIAEVPSALSPSTLPYTQGRPMEWDGHKTSMAFTTFC